MLNKSLTKDKIEAGLDEVGRGCLAGPVVAAAVILAKDVEIEGLRDSKKLSEKKRLNVEVEIKEKALAYHVQEVSPERIDEINILNASFEAMNLAIQELKIKPEFLLVDGNRFRTKLGIPYECVIKGDDKFLSIAAASVLAKNYRDKLMADLHDEFPHYDWKNNVGYPTKKHRQGIHEKGISPYHRKSFKLLPTQLDIFTNE